VWKWSVSARLQRKYLSRDSRSKRKDAPSAYSVNQYGGCTFLPNFKNRALLRPPNNKDQTQKLTFKWYKWKQNTSTFYHLPVLRKNVHFHLKSGGNINLATAHWISEHFQTHQAVWTENGSILSQILFYSVEWQYYNWLSKSLGWLELIISSSFNIQREFITDNLEKEYNF